MKKKINHKQYEVASIDYFPFGQAEKKYRLVIMREPNTTGEMSLFTGDAMIYRGIITDDWKWGEKRIIKFYNARGSAEKVFDMMNNDFGWNKLPFSWLQENTVYLIIMSMCRNFYKMSGMKPSSQTGKTLTASMKLPGSIWAAIYKAATFPCHEAKRQRS